MTTAPDWQGGVGDAWASEWHRTDRGFQGLSPHLDAATRANAPSAGRVADVGCGAGSTSLALAAARPDLRITGLDLSPSLIATARSRALGHDTLDFVEGDVLETLPRLGPVDMLMSRHGVMFFDDAIGALATMRRSCAPGAPLVFTCFRERRLNLWAEDVSAAVLNAAPPPPGRAPGPFAFGEEGYLRDVLDRSGWRLATLDPIDFSYIVGAGQDPLADALVFLSQIGPAAPHLRAAEGEVRAAILSRLTALLESRARPDVIDFPAAAWLVVAHA